LSQLAQLQSDSSSWRRSADEEWLNAATHGVGFIAAVAGALVLTTRAFASHNVWQTVGCDVYAASLVAVYAMSTLSHAATSAQWKSLFRRLDQASIYLLISGTFTPFAVAYLHGDMYQLLLGVMWCVALVGATSKLLFAYRVEVVSIASYVVLAWLPIVALPELWRSAPLGAFESVIAGGLCYSIGLWFFVNDQRAPRFHAAWHLCVMAGSACHFLGIYWFIVCGRG
jgi:hemolysin III